MAIKRTMTTPMGRRGRAAGLVRLAGMLLLLAAAGCAHLGAPAPEAPPEVEDPKAAAEAHALLEGLQRVNEPLRRFKGTGRITIRRDGRIELDGRIAWVGEDPRRLSVVLTAAGFPAMRMATDGEYLYYQDPQDPGDPVKRWRAADPDLKRLLAVPIRVGEIVTLLCGRIPIADHSRARLEPAPAGEGPRLALWQSGRIRQRIHFEPAGESARFAEMYDPDGALLYRADFLETQRVGPYRVPRRLAVVNTEQTEVQLVVENYWADVPVSPAMFVLPPPG